MSSFQFFGMEPYTADPSSRIASALDGIKALIFPVDGVLTDGSITLDGDGRELPRIYARDAVAIREAIRCGLRVAVISGRDAMGYKPLFEAAGPIDLFLEGGDRVDAYETFKCRHGLSDDNCALIADDIEELEILRRVGLPVTPINGVEYLRNRVAYISVFEGGKGCIREVVEMILEHQGRWEYGDRQKDEERS